MKKSTEYSGDALKLALKKAGIKLRKQSVQWPRMKGPVAVRVDCSTGYAVQFVGQRKEASCVGVGSRNSN